MNSTTSQDQRFLSKIRAIIRSIIPHLIPIGKHAVLELLEAIEEMIEDYFINGLTLEETYNRQLERSKRRLLINIGLYLIASIRKIKPQI